MKIAIISKAGRIGGGASRVAEDLAMWLNEAGHATDHFIAFPAKHFLPIPGDDLPFQKSLYGQGLKLKLCKKTHTVTRKLGLQELFPVEYFLTLSQFVERYDVIHFHDLYRAISPLTLALVARRKPTFFTVHDCTAFTGGCLYPMGCHKFTEHCHQCPQLPQATWKDRICDRTQSNQTIKRWLAQHTPVRYIFPSHWMAQQASRALTPQLPPVTIPNGLDLAPFEGINPAEERLKLGIPDHRYVITVSASLLNEPRKGTHYALAAIQSVADLSPIVMTVGRCDADFRQALQGFEVREMGFISERRRMAEVYSASDIMLFCTLADNLPLTVLEAMAAATVIIGFATGGVPEMIQTGRNGVLVEPRDQAALNQALRQALLSGNLRQLGQQAQQDVKTYFSKAGCLKQHLELYQASQNSAPGVHPITPSAVQPAPLSHSTLSPLL